MKFIISRSKLYNDEFPKSLNIDEKEITEKKTSTEKCSSCYINMECNLTTKISSSNTNVESYLANKNYFHSRKTFKRERYQGCFLYINNK